MQKERRVVADARGLLHRMRHDHDRVDFLQLADEIFDLARRDRVERRGRLVHQDDFGIDGETARDAEPLLLPARERERGAVEAILDFVPERGVTQDCARRSPSASPLFRSP